MTQLTEERFEQLLDKRLTNLATKDDLKPLATKRDVREGVEELARIVKAGFDGIDRRLAVTKDVEVLKLQMQEIRHALKLDT
jgi:hypothetical protein